MRLKAFASATALIGMLAGVAPAQQQDSSVGRAASQPLRDTRIKEDKIPEALLLAASAPYSADGTRTCAQIADQVRTLNAALGNDVDAVAGKKGEGAYVASAATKAAINTLIPVLGLVRVITGADKAQRRAEAAAYAGSVRRAYLKGLGLSKGCRAPAAPTAAAVADRMELPPVEDK